MVSEIDWEKSQKEERKMVKNKEILVIVGMI